MDGEKIEAQKNGGKPLMSAFEVFLTNFRYKQDEIYQVAGEAQRELAGFQRLECVFTFRLFII